MLKKGFTCGRI